jgi:hypothetical protein
MKEKTLEDLVEDLTKWEKTSKEQILKELNEIAEKHGLTPEEIAKGILKAFLTCQ